MTVFDAIVELTKASWRVLRRNPTLMWFPLLSLLSTIVVLVFLGPILLRDEPTWLALFAIGFAIQLVAIFWRVGLTSEALKALRGERPSVAGGVAAAMSRPSAIVSLSAVTSSVGFVLGLLGRSSRGAVRIARALIGTAWSLATYLAVPVMVQERRGGIPSLRRSGDLFKRTWGETTLSEVGLRVITAHLAFLLLVVAVLLVKLLGDSALAILLVFALVAAFAAVIGALEAIYRSALYVFASEGVVPEPFGGPELDDIWRVK
ncbi:MAG TPA: DUF6159 family protein [Kofleriaceae bacterium]|nr:DUF6159 family protein [Kofleriaceae bacterium]